MSGVRGARCAPLLGCIRVAIATTRTLLGALPYIAARLPEREREGCCFSFIHFSLHGTANFGLWPLLLCAFALRLWSAHLRLRSTASASAYDSSLHSAQHCTRLCIISAFRWAFDTPTIALLRPLRVFSNLRFLDAETIAILVSSAEKIAHY